MRAGADDFVSANSESALLVQTVIARAARGRRIREMVHRDGLTGLLNHATLMSELEGAVDFSRRYGEPLAFVIFELAGFQALGERLGPRAGMKCSSMWPVCSAPMCGPVMSSAATGGMPSACCSGEPMPLAPAFWPRTSTGC